MKKKKPTQPQSSIGRYLADIKEHEGHNAATAKETIKKSHAKRKKVKK